MIPPAANEPVSGAADAAGPALVLCCIGPADAVGLPAEAGSDAERPLRVIDDGDLRAIAVEVSPVDVQRLRGFHAEDGPAAGSESAAWLARWAGRHERIIRQANAAASVLPVRFGCIYPGADAVRSMLRSHADRLEPALRQVGGAAEFVVRLRVDRPLAIAACTEGHGGERSPGTSSGPTSPTDGMADAGEGPDLGPWIASRIGPTIATLDAMARMSCRHRLGSGACGRRDVGAIWSFLVADDDRAAFRAELVGRPASEGDGLDLDGDGPWPAYSFAPALAGA